MADRRAALPVNDGAVRTGDRALSARVPIETRAAELCDAAEALAHTFRRGGRLLTQSGAGFEHDAAHVTVEFLHPVVTGARALPALRIDDPGGRSVADRLRAIARHDDAWLGIGSFEQDPALAEGAAEAKRLGLLTLAIVDLWSTDADVDHHITVDSLDGVLLRDQLVTSYHVLWELVHLVLAHEGSTA